MPTPDSFLATSGGELTDAMFPTTGSALVIATGLNGSVPAEYEGREVAYVYSRAYRQAARELATEAKSASATGQGSVTLFDTAARDMRREAERWEAILGERYHRSSIRTTSVRMEVSPPTRA